MIATNLLGGLIIILVSVGLPLLPVTINGSHDILPAKTLNLFPRAVDIIIHPPIPVTDNSSEEQLLAQARERIASQL